MSVAADPLVPPLSPAAFARFVKQGQWLKLSAFLAAIALAATGHATRLDLVLLVSFYALTMLGVTAGLHRLFSHQSFACGPFLRGALAVLATMAGQGSVPIWVAIHRRHHQHADRPGDPHSPHVKADGAPASLWHSQTGWVLGFYPTELARYVPDLLRDPFQMGLHRWSIAVVWAGTLLPAAIGYACTHNALGALGGFVWGGWARMFLVEQGTCMVNSLGHYWGRRPFETHDRSTNLGPLALLTLGDGWHNNHHAFPASARHGLAWWELDPTYWLIRLGQGLGLVHQVIEPDRETVRAKRSRSAEAA